MGEYRTKTIIEISADEFKKGLDDFTEKLDGNIIDIILKIAPESSNKLITPDGNPNTVFYNVFTAIIIYKPRKHVIDKYKKFKKNKKVRNKRKNLDKILA